MVGWEDPLLTLKPFLPTLAVKESRRWRHQEYLGFPEPSLKGDNMIWYFPDVAMGVSCDE
jgi:hypothetical protein